MVSLEGVGHVAHFMTLDQFSLLQLMTAAEKKRVFFSLLPDFFMARMVENATRSSLRRSIVLQNKELFF